jgi:hypothetical protein
VGHLQRFQPFEIASEDSRNTADLSLYCARASEALPVLASLSKAEREVLCGELVKKSAGMVLYLRMVVDGLREGSLRLEELGQMEVALGGLCSRYYSGFEYRFGAHYQEKVQPLMRLVMAAPGPLPLDLAAEVLGWDRESAVRARALIGSYLVEDSAGLRLFHKTLGEWLQNTSNGEFYTDTSSAFYALADFLWRDREAASHGLFANSDGFTNNWWARTRWIKRLSQEGYSQRLWLNALQRNAKESALSKGELSKAVEYSRRSVCLAYEAWGGAHDIFEMAKMEFDELKERLQATQ